VGAEEREEGEGRERDAEEEIHAKFTTALKMTLKPLLQVLISLATTLPPHSLSTAERNSCR